MENKTFQNIFMLIFFLILVVLAFFILRPIAMSIVFGLLAAYVFNPMYKKILFKIRYKNLSAAIVCIIILLIILTPIWFLTPVIIKQSFNIYTYIQGADLVEIVGSILPAFSSQEISLNVISSLNNFISEITSYILNSFAEMFLNIPQIMFQFFIVLFTFFFALRDGDKLIEYLRSFSIFSEDSRQKFFDRFRNITQSVIVGQVVVGILQGIITGIGLLIFRVPNALVLTIVATLVGILPIIGPWFVWVPVVLYLFINGRTGSAIGLLIYGLVIVAWIDALIRPYIVSRKTKINSGILLIGMIGGLFFFGIMGLILGPLILSYLIIIIESYRSGKFSSFFFKPTDNKV